MNLIEEITEDLNNNQYIDNNINIHISYKDNKNEKLIEKNLEILKKNKNLGFDRNIYICIIGFKEANNNLINKIVKEKRLKYTGITLKYINGLIIKNLIMKIKRKKNIKNI